MGPSYPIKGGGGTLADANLPRNERLPRADNFRTCQHAVSLLGISSRPSRGQSNLNSNSPSAVALNLRDIPGDVECAPSDAAPIGQSKPACSRLRCVSGIGSESFLYLLIEQRPRVRHRSAPVRRRSGMERSESREISCRLHACEPRAAGDGRTPRPLHAARNSPLLAPGGVPPIGTAYRLSPTSSHHDDRVFASPAAPFPLAACGGAQV